MSAGLELLSKHDADLVVLESETGCVAVTPRYQGRIFCALGDDLIHRLDAPLLDAPAGGEFKNIGGNSLWPAPEGGAGAFNYPPDSDDWYVQAAIAEQPAELRSATGNKVHIGKTIELLNRRGVTVRLKLERRVGRAVDQSWPAPEGMETVAYRCEDSFTPLEAYPIEEVLIAPWSLEQFPGGRDVTAFARVQTPEEAINYDFYGMPDNPPAYGPDFFRLDLGGPAKFQIGDPDRVRGPDLLGALNRGRELLILRRMDPQEGTYFNIADNDQPDGPWSAADMYSVFNGGDLDFFELETIAPMQTKDNHVARSTLTSDTLVVRGPVEKLAGYVKRHWGVGIASN